MAWLLNSNILNFGLNSTFDTDHMALRKALLSKPEFIHLHIREDGNMYLK